MVAEGALEPSGMFKADSVLAKHDETYMPKEVADALKKQGHWKEARPVEPTRQRDDAADRQVRSGEPARGGA